MGMGFAPLGQGPLVARFGIGPYAPQQQWCVRSVLVGMARHGMPTEFEFRFTLRSSLGTLNSFIPAAEYACQLAIPSQTLHPRPLPVRLRRRGSPCRCSKLHPSQPRSSLLFLAAKLKSPHEIEPQPIFFEQSFVHLDILVTLHVWMSSVILTALATNPPKPEVALS